MSRTHATRPRQHRSYRSSRPSLVPHRGRRSQVKHGLEQEKRLLEGYDERLSDVQADWLEDRGLLHAAEHLRRGVDPGVPYFRKH